MKFFFWSLDSHINPIWPADKITFYNFSEKLLSANIWFDFVKQFYLIFKVILQEYIKLGNAVGQPMGITHH